MDSVLVCCLGLVWVFPGQKISDLHIFFQIEHTFTCFARATNSLRR